MLDKKMLLKVQGFNIKDLNCDGVTDAQARKMIGNAMSANVADRVLSHLLHSGGWLPALPVDRWAAQAAAGRYNFC